MSASLESRKSRAHSPLKWGVEYFSERTHYTSPEQAQYAFQVFAGAHEIAIEAGDACFHLSGNKREAILTRGRQKVLSSHFAAVVRGYAPPDKRSAIFLDTNLPYVNGCSTRQIFPPERPGDPTWQLLRMPPATTEQMHHIHTTARAVYVLHGSGISVVGMGDRVQKQALFPGTVCVLDPMCPHHFQTQDDELIVLPVHVWSTVPGVESNHPMFHGTIPVNHS